MRQVRFTIRLVEKLNEALEKVAQETGRSKNAIVIDACYEYLNLINESGKFLLDNEVDFQE